MKVLFFNHDKDYEATLENGEVFTLSNDESFAAFEKRVSSRVENDLMETVETEIETSKTLKRISTKELSEMVTGSALKAKAISDILSKRKVVIEPKVLENTKPKAEKVSKPKAEKVSKPKAEKVLPTLEQVNDEVAKAELNIGKAISFKSFGGEVQTGVIKTVSVNKRAMRVNYVIKGASGKTYRARTTNASVVVDEDATQILLADAIKKAEADKIAKEQAKAKTTAKGQEVKDKAVSKSKDKAKAKTAAENNAVTASMLDDEAPF